MQGQPAIIWGGISDLLPQLKEALDRHRIDFFSQDSDRHRIHFFRYDFEHVEVDERGSGKRVQVR